MTHLITGVNAQDVETLEQMVKEMVVSHHKVEGFDALRTKSKQSIAEWYNDTISKMQECKPVYGYKLYSGDEDITSETLLTVIAVGHIRVESSIQ
jgi:hypothetical protein